MSLAQDHPPRDYPLPRSDQAEAAIIGCCLIDHKAFPVAAELVAETDFHSPVTGAIFAAMVSLDGAGRAIDRVTVADEMRARGSLDVLRAHGGEGHLYRFGDAIPTTENVAYYARIVRNLARARGMLYALDEGRARGYGDLGDVDEFLDTTSAAVLAAAEHPSEEAAQPVRQILGAVIKNIEQRYDRKQAITGVPSGFHKLDAMTAGFQPGDLIVIAARPAMGKTSLAMNAVQSAAIDHGVAALVFSLEMSKESLVERLLCSEARIDSTRLRSGFLEQRDWISLTKAASRIAQANITIDDKPAPTLFDIRIKTRRWVARLEPGQRGIVAVDYLQRVRTPKDGRRDSVSREVGENSSGLKTLAREIQMPVLCMSQLSRACESRADKRPMLSDLRDSGEIEQDADVIAFIYRDEVYNKETADRGVAEAIVAKQRNGPIGTVRLAFLNQYTRFENLAEHEDYEPARTGKTKWRGNGYTPEEAA